MVPIKMIIKILATSVTISHPINVILNIYMLFSTIKDKQKALQKTISQNPATYNHTL